MIEHLPRMLGKWNSGNLVFKRISSILSFILKTNFTINLTLHYPKTHYSIVPSFQL
jgi:hypothetical protein